MIRGIVAVLTLVCLSFASAAEPIRFFRLMVPEDRLDDLGQLYIPIKAAEFQRLVDAHGGGEGGPTSAARIAKAKHRARFDGVQLAAGESLLEIERLDKSPRWLPWPEFAVAISSAIWAETPPRPALLGKASTGEQGLWVDSSAPLKLRWTLRGKTAADGAVDIPLSLPQAMVGEIEIETGAAVRLEAEDGVPVEELSPAVAAEASAAEEPRPGAARVWRLSLGAKHAAKLRFVAATAPVAPPPRVLLRETASYEINPSSLDLRADWKLDISEAPLKQLTLQSDLETSLAEIRLGDKNLTWTTKPEQGKWTAVVELPEPLFGQDRQIMIRALAPVKLGGRRKLPRIQLIGATWREGESQVEVIEPLRVDDVFIKDGRQSAFVGESAADSRASLRFQHFTPDSVPELTLSRSGGGLRAAAGTLVQIDAHRLTAISQWDLSTEAGERFHANFELPRAWIIDSVETTPPELLEDRIITPLSPERQQLEIRLRQPIRPERKLRLTIRAHCRRPSNEEGLSIALLRLATLRDADQIRKLAAVEVLDSALQLQPAGDITLEQLTAAQLPEEERRLLPSAGNLLFVDDERADGLQLTLERRRARFSAVTRHQITVERHLLDHQVTIRCLPEGASPRRMTVRVAAPTSAGVDWKSALIALGEGGAEGATESLPGDFTARRLPAAIGDSGENWLLEWSRPPTGVFEVTARFSQGFDQKRQLPLVSVPEASAQNGLIDIRATEAGIFALDAPETEPLPLDATPASIDEPALRARLRYEPARASAIAILPRSGPALAAVYVRKLDLLTRFGVDGGALHQMRAELQNDGGTGWRFLLPSGAQLLQAAVDGRELEADYRPGETQWRTAALPHCQARPLVELTYSTPGWKDPIPWRNSWQVALPEFESPVIARRWRILTPPGFVLAGEDLQRTAYEETGIGSAGWTCFELPWPAAGERKLSFVRPPRTLAFRGALMLAVAGLMLLWRGMRTATLLPLLVIAGGAVWLAPAGWTWIGEGALWGLTAAMIIRACRAQPAPVIVLPRRGDTTTGAAAAALSAVLLCGWVQAQDAVKPPEAKPFTVVTPIDKDGKPAGDYLYIDPRLNAALLRGADKSPSRDVSWVLGGAEYRVVFRSAAESDFALHEVTAAWEIVTERPQAKVQLPLNVDEIVILGGLQVGEREVPVDWDRENRRLSFTIEEIGRHRVQLAFRPKTVAAADGRVTSLVIPRVPTARVTIESPAVGPEIECLAGETRFVREAAVPEASFEIGAASKLQFRWREALNGVKDPGSSGEQLLWWRVKPNAVSVDAFLRIKPGKEPLTSIDVEADSRLRLLPPDAALRLKTETLTIGGETIRRITLPEPATREFNLNLSFQLQGESGLGRFVPPRIALKIDRLQRRWSAVTSARGLMLGAVDRGGSELLPPHEFSGAWSTEDLPEAAFRTVTGPEAWNVEIRPDEPLPQATEELSVAYTGPLVRLHYTADLSRLGSRRFLHRVRVPAEMQIERVTIEEGAATKTCVWNRTRPDQLTVTVRDADTELDRKLIVVGRLPNGADGPLPRITLAETDLRQSRIRIYRGEHLRLQCEPQAPFQFQEVKMEELTTDRGRLAAELVAAAPQLKDMGSPAKITLAPNRPQIAGRIITRVERAAGGWSAEVELEFDVRDGLLDQLPLEVPAEWTAPKVLTTYVDTQSRTPTGQARRRITLQPKRPWTGKQTVKLQGPLPAAETGLRAPDVVVKEGEWDRWVVLPKRVAPEMTWTLSGLQQSPPPEPTMTVDREYYRVVGPRFEALMKSGELERGRATVSLAATRLERGLDGRITGSTRFALVPQGLTHCDLLIPPSLRIVRVTIDDRPALVQTQDESRLRIDTVSARLPQDVIVEFEVTARETSAVIDLPSLEGPEVKHALCILADAKPPPRPVTAAVLIAAELEQLESDADAARTVAEVSDGAESTDAAVAWFARRTPRFHARLYNLRLPTTNRSSETTERLEAAERTFAAAAKAVVPAGTPQPATPQTWDDPLLEGSLAEVRMSETPLNSFAVRPRATAGFSLTRELVLALLIGAVAAVIAWLARQPPVAEYCRQQPQLALALGGVLWAIFLPPAWFGWLLAGAAVFAAVLPIGRSRWIAAR